jgi:GNAT superfamily N-acetyltransferase
LIRPAREDDLAVLLPLMRGYCDFYGADPSDEGLMEMARALIAAKDSEGFLLVAAEHGEAPVLGFAACGWKWSSLRGARICILEDLFVGEEGRGKGYADALIGACAERARELGAPVMTWLTAPDNLRAQSVYERVGGRSEEFLEYELELGEP